MRISAFYTMCLLISARLAEKENVLLGRLIRRDGTLAFFT